MGSSTTDEGNRNFLLQVSVLEETHFKSAKKSQTEHIEDEDNVKSVLLAQEMLSERVLLLERSIRDKSEEIHLLREFVSNSERTMNGAGTIESSTALLTTAEIPGFRVLRNVSGKNGIHKLLWIVVHLVVLFISYYYIQDAYKMWQESPIILGTKTTLTDVESIPFPAITICFPNSLSRNYYLMENMAKCFKCDGYNNSAGWACDINADCSDTDMIALRFSFMLCDADIWYDQDSSRYVAMKDYFETRESVESEQFHQIMKFLLPECKASGLKLYASKSEYDLCNTHFQQSMVKQKRNYVCTTYNSLPFENIFRTNVIPSVLQNSKLISHHPSLISQWNTDNMLDYKWRKMLIPDYNPETRFLEFNHQVSDLDDMCSPGAETDYKIAIHNPGDIPMIESVSFFTYKAGMNVAIQLKPVLTTVHESIKRYDPNHRGCYFSDEKKLTLFKHYTEKNCFLECKMKCSIKFCGCVPFYLPIIYNSVNVCLDFPQGEGCEEKFLKNFPESCECDCLPDCNSLSYDHDGTQTVGFSSAYRGEPKVSIGYTEPQFKSSVRFSIVHSHQFISYTFGMLLMLNGISVIWIIEVIYLIILKLWN